jgi:hypothetical protein
MPNRFIGGHHYNMEEPRHHSSRECVPPTVVKEEDPLTIHGPTNQHQMYLNHHIDTTQP